MSREPFVESTGSHVISARTVVSGERGITIVTRCAPTVTTISASAASGPKRIGSAPGSSAGSRLPNWPPSAPLLRPAAPLDERQLVTRWFSGDVRKATNLVAAGAQSP